MSENVDLVRRSNPPEAVQPGKDLGAALEAVEERE
jgi:hypothetical protein